MNHWDIPTLPPLAALGVYAGDARDFDGIPRILAKCSESISKLDEADEFLLLLLLLCEEIVESEQMSIGSSLVLFGLCWLDFICCHCIFVKFGETGWMLFTDS